MNTRAAIHAMPQVLRHHLAEFGADILKARKRRKLSQAVMAHRCLTTPLTIRKVEPGDPPVSFVLVACMLLALCLYLRLLGSASFWFLFCLSVYFSFFSFSFIYFSFFSFFFFFFFYFF